VFISRRLFSTLAEAWPTPGYVDSEIERMTLGLRPRAAIASIVVMTQ
jgi:hypothetical protein